MIINMLHRLLEISDVLKKISYKIEDCCLFPVNKSYPGGITQFCNSILV
jgi:hypothetical protein